MIDGDPARLLNHTFWYAKLPDTAALHANSPAIVAEVVRQSQILQPVVNATVWTAELIEVPKDQPVIPGTCAHDSTMAAIAANGLPIPPDFIPTNDSDSALTLYQPDPGFMWELQGFHWGTPGVQWQCNSLARMSAVNGTRSGHFVNYVTGPGGKTPGATYSTYEQAAWGIQGSGLPYAPGVLTMADIRRGYVNHALLLEVFDAAAGSHVWPAARGDGGAGPTNPAHVISEGMWLRLPAGYAVPAVDPITALYAQAARDFGWIITDRTLSCLAVRAHPSAATTAGGNNHLTGFPWADLQCLLPGTDATPHP